MVAASGVAGGAITTGETANPAASSWPAAGTTGAVPAKAATRQRTNLFMSAPRHESSHDARPPTLPSNTLETLTGAITRETVSHACGAEATLFIANKTCRLAQEEPSDSQIVDSRPSAFSRTADVIMVDPASGALRPNIFPQRKIGLRLLWGKHEAVLHAADSEFAVPCADAAPCVGGGRPAARPSAG